MYSGKCQLLADLREKKQPAASHCFILMINLQLRIVDRRLVDQRRLRLRRQNLPLLLMHAHVRVVAWHETKLHGTEVDQKYYSYLFGNMSWI